MSNIPRLTKESEARISSALAAVADLTNSGMAPNDAIVKVASDRKINAGHVRLMVRAFNNGRSLGHLNEHYTLAEKAASFPLADAEEVLERMFPSVVKSASEAHAAVAVSDDYRMSPAGWLKRAYQESTRKELMTKAAAAPKSQVPAYPPLPARAGRKALSALMDLRREHTRIKDAAIAASYKVASDMNAVGEYFRRVDALPAAEVSQNVAARYGAPGAKLVKYASANRKQLPRTGITHAVDWNAAPYNLIGKAITSMQDFQEKKAALEEYERQLPSARAAHLKPFHLEQPIITGSVWDDQPGTEKVAVGIVGLGLAAGTGGLARGMAEKLSPKTYEQRVQDQLNKLSQPSHEDQLRAIRTKTMMHEMMASDPVISGYDPETVMEAFNHLSEVAPRAMQQRLMAQALIRKYLEQSAAIDPFDVDQLLDVEGKITGRDMPEQLAANHSTGVARELGPPQSKPRGYTERAPEPKDPIMTAVKPLVPNELFQEDKMQRDLAASKADAAAARTQISTLRKQLDELKKQLPKNPPKKPQSGTP